TKKMDNAEAQREKEKTTLYTRNIIIEAIQKTLPEVINCVIKAFDTYTKNSSGNDVDVTVNFGEYASPSFEATVETVAKARPGKVIMSVEASVDEMYGDSKDEEWKAEEIKRLRIENGVMETQEPVISEFDDLGGTIPTPEDYEGE
ncbi:capsid protein, partial [[Clostridium] innocuum]|nr:capsid protein [[Clostridium] innocuum]MCR0355161.1 capsid protein [[Clostridium] innocuum]